MQLLLVQKVKFNSNFKPMTQSIIEGNYRLYQNDSKAMIKGKIKCKIQCKIQCKMSTYHIYLILPILLSFVKHFDTVGGCSDNPRHGGLDCRQFLFQLGGF